MRIPEKYRRGWHLFDPCELMSLPELPACYVFIVDGQAVYVGQSSNLRARVRSHNPRYGYGGSVMLPWTSVPSPILVILKAKFCGPYGSHLMREARLIRKLAPRFNKSMQHRSMAA